MLGEIRYRYECRRAPSPVYYHSLEIMEFIVIRETECYEWVATPGIAFSVIKNLPATFCEVKKFKAKRITKNAARRFAYPTKELALYSFMYRQDMREQHALRNLRAAEAGTLLARKELEKLKNEV